MWINIWILNLYLIFPWVDGFSSLFLVRSFRIDTAYLVIFSFVFDNFVVALHWYFFSSYFSCLCAFLNLSPLPFPIPHPILLCPTIANQTIHHAFPAKLAQTCTVYCSSEFPSWSSSVKVLYHTPGKPNLLVAWRPAFAKFPGDSEGSGEWEVHSELIVRWQTADGVEE